MVYRNDQWRAAQGANLSDEINDLIRRLVIACKKDDSAHGRLAQQIAVSRGQAEAIDIEHYGAEGHCQKISKPLRKLNKHMILFTKHSDRLNVRCVREHVDNACFLKRVAVFVH